MTNRRHSKHNDSDRTSAQKGCLDATAVASLLDQANDAEVKKLEGDLTAVKTDLDAVKSDVSELKEVVSAGTGPLGPMQPEQPSAPEPTEPSPTPESETPVSSTENGTPSQPELSVKTDAALRAERAQRQAAQGTVTPVLVNGQPATPAQERAARMTVERAARSPLDGTKRTVS